MQVPSHVEYERATSVEHALDLLQWPVGRSVRSAAGVANRTVQVAGIGNFQQ